MKHLKDFIHFLNLEKKFEFIQTKDIPKELNSISESQYQNLDYNIVRLLKYNDYTLKEFEKYIKSSTVNIKNEILDAFHQSKKEQLSELDKRRIYLQKQIAEYRSLKSKLFKNIVIYFPEGSVKLYNKLLDFEKKEVSRFLQLEHDLVCKVSDLIINQENEYSYNAKKDNKITGFEFNTSLSINYQPILSLLYGDLIECNDLKIFEKVFSGQILNTPPKIKWLLKHQNKNPNKRALFYFLESSIFKNMTKKELIQKVDYCFVDQAGKKFGERTGQNYYLYNKHLKKINSPDYDADWKHIIDEKVAAIQNYLQS